MNEHKYREYFASDDNCKAYKDRFTSTHMKCGIIKANEFAWNPHRYDIHEVHDGLITHIVRNITSDYRYEDTFLIGFLLNDEYCSHIHVHSKSRFVKGSMTYIACNTLLNHAFGCPIAATYEIIGNTIYAHMEPEDYMEIMLSS